MEIMKKKPSKPYWEMTTAELREATKQFDEEFVGDKAKPLSPRMKALWEKAKAKGEADVNGATDAHIAVRLDKDLLKRCTALAKKKRLTRDALIARGLRALLAAEGE
jgi:phosphatidylserine/phosphatidylglycerophosphate/cardiolipin synthase-like enzyme